MHLEHQVLAPLFFHFNVTALFSTWLQMFKIILKLLQLFTVIINHLKVFKLLHMSDWLLDIVLTFNKTQTLTPLMGKKLWDSRHVGPPGEFTRTNIYNSCTAPSFFPAPEPWNSQPPPPWTPLVWQRVEMRMKMKKKRKKNYFQQVSPWNTHKDTKPSICSCWCLWIGVNLIQGQRDTKELSRIIHIFVKQEMKDTDRSCHGDAGQTTLTRFCFV